MNADYRIQYFTHYDIDKVKWDACADAAANSLIYSYSWYLDAMSPKWDALVLNDYEAVMPLVWKKKFGFYYLYQPFLTAQLGITGNRTDASITDAFLNALPPHFKFAVIDLNETNNTVDFNFACCKRTNMLLNTVKEYSDVQKGYHRLATRMIKKATAEGLQIEVNSPIPESIEFYKQQYNAQLKIRLTEYEKVISMFQEAASRKQVISLTAKKNNQLLGMYILLLDKKYAYSVIGGSSAQGKENGAFYLLTDHAIKMVCSTVRHFRFEGSDLPGIAAFNQQFGAMPFYYNHVKLDRLPSLLKIFKK